MLALLLVKNGPTSMSKYTINFLWGVLITPFFLASQGFEAASYDHELERLKSWINDTPKESDTEIIIGQVNALGNITDIYQSLKNNSFTLKADSRTYILEAYKLKPHRESYTIKIKQGTGAIYSINYSNYDKSKKTKTSDLIASISGKNLEIARYADAEKIYLNHLNKTLQSNIKQCNTQKDRDLKENACAKYFTNATNRAISEVKSHKKFTLPNECMDSENEKSIFGNCLSRFKQKFEDVYIDPQGYALLSTQSGLCAIATKKIIHVKIIACGALNKTKSDSSEYSTNIVFEKAIGVKND